MKNNADLQKDILYAIKWEPLLNAEKIGVILTAAFYDPRHAQFLAQHTGARVVAMAHQVGARPGTDDYLGMVDYDIRQLVAALGSSSSK